MSQSSRTIVRAALDQHQSAVYQIPLSTEGPFLSFFLAWEGSAKQSQIRFSGDGRNWTDWQTLTRDEHSADLPLSRLGSTSIHMRYFQLRKQSPEDAAGSIHCHFFNPGHTEPKVSSAAPSSTDGRSCSDLTPPYLLRSEWCPGGNCAEHTNPSFASVTHLVIHHSAGTNESDDWPAVVRAIWDYHVNGRGWSDIGYNWLVDPEGRIYQGRSNDAIGAHFCGTNTGTIGICVLGDFTEKAPQPEAITVLKKLLSWKACENSIDPLAEVFHASSGKTLPTVIGHRDGCATACPGDLFYPQLTEIRTDLDIDSTTPVRDKQELGAFQVYPNPGRHAFSIALPAQASGLVQAQVFDMSGQLVSGPVRLGPDHHLNLDLNLPAGTYTLVLHAANGYLGTQKVSILD